MFTYTSGPFCLSSLQLTRKIRRCTKHYQSTTLPVETPLLPCLAPKASNQMGIVLDQANGISLPLSWPFSGHKALVLGGFWGGGSPWYISLVCAAPVAPYHRPSIVFVKITGRQGVGGAPLPKSCPYPGGKPCRGPLRNYRGSLAFLSVRRISGLRRV